MNYVLVFIGGGLGSCLRYTLSLLIKTKPNSFPWSTLSANLISCFLIGMLIALISKGNLTQTQKLLFITGFCGGFSTFSTFGAEVIQLIKAGMIGLALSYILISVVLGSLLVIGGTLIVEMRL